MVVIVDRLEEKFAVCEKEDLSIMNIPIEKLPEDVNEGDILVIDGENIFVDKEATNIRREELEKLFNS